MNAVEHDGDRSGSGRGEDARQAGSFFGRRKGHKLRAHQADLIERLLPRLALDVAGAAPRDPTTLFDPRVEQVRLEIGFGGGEHLAAEAGEFPRTGFIGCEPYVNGMAKILTQIGEKKAALEAYDQLLKIHPNIEGGETARDELKKEVEGQGI